MAVLLAGGRQCGKAEECGCAQHQALEGCMDFHSNWELALATHLVAVTKYRTKATGEGRVDFGS